MKISVFLSYPKPHISGQQNFIERFEEFLRTRGLEPRTLGVTDYDMDAPLKAIRRLMLESNGLITVAFRRSLVLEAKVRANSDMVDAQESQMADVWLTSPYCQIEPAMAYQLGLPVLVLREKGVIQEGLLERGVVGTYMPEFSLADDSVDYLMSHEWNSLVGKWEGFVRSVVEMKGNPPKLYGYQDPWKETSHGAGITEEYFNKYFAGREIGYALSIKNAERFDESRDLEGMFGIKHPPQSFRYVSVP